MKILLKAVFLFALFGLLFLSCSDESQFSVNPTDQTSLDKVTIREFTAINTPVGVIAPGVVTYPDNKVKVRFHVAVTGFAATYLPGDTGPDILSGPGEVEINGLVDINTFAGQWQGYLKLMPEGAGGGTWLFTWHGTSEFNPTAWQGGPGFTIALQQIGHGEGGDIQGMQCRLETTIYSALDFSGWYGDVKGVIRAH